MWYLIVATFLVLLLMSVAFYGKPDDEQWLWIKLPFYLATFIVSFNIFVVRIPILVLWTYLSIRNKQLPNKRSKQLALGFALVLFLISNYLIPVIGYAHLGLSREIYGAMLRFQRVDSVQVFSPDLVIQQQVRSMGEFNGPALALGLFVAGQEQLELAEQELGWHTQQALIDAYGFDYYLKTIKGETYVTTLGAREVSDGYEIHMAFRKLGLVYYAIFDTHDGQKYLKYVIKGKLLQDAWPKFPF